MSTNSLSLGFSAQLRAWFIRCIRLVAGATLVAAVAACGGGSDPDQDTASPQAKEFKGTVTAINSPTSFQVEGIPVNASSTSVPSTVAVGTQVTVSGVMTNGVITATRVEFEGAAPAAGEDRPNRIEGRVTSYTSLASFAVNGIPVDASGAERIEGTVAVGAIADVRGIVVNGVMIANRVKVEGVSNASSGGASGSGNGGGGSDDDRDEDDDDSRDDDGVVDELEGVITAFGSNTSFVVGSTPVNASGVASFPSGLGVGVRVEMDGRLTNGVFVATTLKIDD